MSGIKILIVEDDPRIAKALSVRLKSAGYEVATAADATGGVQALVREKPDLVLLDISMPGGGGFFVAENMARRPAFSATPVIFITASKAPDIRERAMSLDPAAFIEKPFKSHELMAVIEATLAGANVDELMDDFERRVPAPTSPTSDSHA